MKKQLSILLFFLLCHSAFAQDPAFTQWINSRLLTNPAFAGNEPGIRFTGNNRSQWRSIPDKYVTNAFTLEGAFCRLRNVGFGLTFMNDVEGMGLLRTTDVGIIYSYKVTGSKWSLGFGLQGNAGWKTIDWSKFIFSDQLDPVIGVTGPSSNHTATTEKRFYPDFSAGILFRRRINTTHKEIYSHIGLTASHIFQPADGFLSSYGKIPSKYTLHTGLVIPVVDIGKKTKLSLVPLIRYLVQDYNKSNHQQLDALISVYSKSAFGGIGYRFNPRSQYLKNTDAVMITAGLLGVMNRWTLYRLSYSYDINYKGVSNGNVGSHEVSLVLSIDNICRSKRKQRNDCFDFAKKGLPKIF